MLRAEPPLRVGAHRVAQPDPVGQLGQAVGVLAEHRGGGTDPILRAEFLVGLGPRQGAGINTVRSGRSAQCRDGLAAAIELRWLVRWEPDRLQKPSHGATSPEPRATRCTGSTTFLGVD